MSRSIAAFLFATFLAAPARAHEGHGDEVCPPGELCGPAALVGSWGLIALGLSVLLVALLPTGAPGEAGEGRGFAPLRRLRARMSRETTGWRRLQWPALGLLFIALGVATLVGWR